MFRHAVFFFLLGIISSSVSAIDFGNHGMFWSSAPNRTSSISQQGIWQPIDDTTDVHFSINDTRTVTITYHASVEGYRTSNVGMPLPKEAKDFLQVRCLIDNVPHKASGSHTSSFLVEPRKVGSVGGIFTVELQEGSHIVGLEWRKLGYGIQKWSTLSSSDNGVNTGYSLVVATDHDFVWSLHDKEPASLVQPNMWSGLGEVLTVSLSRKCTVYFQYSISVSPEMSSTFIKDRNQEFINTRLSVNGVGYREGSLVHGAATWNPSPATLSGFMTLTLPPGSHSVRLQWKRSGSVFQSWVSQPSFLGGFSAARNIIVSVEKVNLPFFEGHDRAILRGDGNWHTVSNKIFSFSLIKESAIHISYGLPVSQYGNPNFDANIWHRLNDIQARVMVDGIGYRYSASMTSGTSRSIDSMYGNLALILPAGSHSIALQWKTDEHNWTTLNAIEDGFTQGDQLLVLLSSENVKPVIRHPLSYSGDEDEILPLAGLSIEDIDDALVAGMKIRLQMNVTHGYLRLPSIKEYTNEILTTSDFVEISRSFDFEESITNINSLLAQMTYAPVADWFGIDELHMEVSDLDNVGAGGEQWTSSVMDIHIINVDDPFSIDMSTNLVVNEGGNIDLGYVNISDIDSQDSIFRVEMASFCGLLSLSADVSGMEDLNYIRGDGNADSLLEIEAPYSSMQIVMSHVAYSSRTACNRNQHVEAITYKFMDTSNYDFNVTKVLNIEILPLNNPPQVQSISMPRWTVSGIQLNHENKAFSGADFSFLHLPLTSETSTKVRIENDDSHAITTNTPVTLSGEAGVFYGEQNEVFAMNLDFSHNQLHLLAYNVIPRGVETNVTLISDVDISLSADSLYCFIGMSKFRALYDSLNRSVSCEIFLETDDRVVFMGLSGVELEGDSTYTSNLLPLFVHPRPVIQSIYPFCVFKSSRGPVELKVSDSISTEVCLFDDVITSAYTSGNTVLCSLPNFSHVETPARVAVYVMRLDGSFISDPVFLNVVNDPEVTNVSLVNVKGFNYISVAGDWGDGICGAIDTAHILCKLSGTKTQSPHVVTNSAVMCQANVPNLNFFATSIVTSLPLRSDTEFVVRVVVSSGEVKYLVIEAGIEIIQSDMSVSVQCEESLSECGSVSYPSDTTEFDASVSLPHIQLVYISVGNVAWDFLVRAELNMEGDELVHGINNFDIVYPIQLQIDSFLTPLHSFVLKELSSEDTLHEEVQVNMTELQLSSVSAISFSNGYFIRIHGGLFPLACKLTCLFTTSNDELASSFAVVQSLTEVTCAIPFDNAISVRLQDEDTNSLSLSVPLTPDTGEDSLWNIDSEGERLSEALYLLEGSSIGQEETPSQKFHVLSITPLVSTLAGQGVLSVAGVGFLNSVSEGSSLHCQFGNVLVAAGFISDSEIHCIIPSSTVVGHQMFSVKLADDTFRSESFVFTYINEVILTQVTPSSGPTSGGVPVIMWGLLFPIGKSAFCIFGTEAVSGRMLNSTSVECISPPGIEGSVPLSLELDGMVVSAEGMEYLYVANIQILSLSPAIGGVDGGTNVTVMGSDFSTFREISCRFGDSKVEGMHLSDGGVRCVTPSHVEGAVLVVITLDDVMSVTAPAEFVFVKVPVVESISPAMGTVSGGTVVTVTGYGFHGVDGTTVHCVFGTHEVDGTLLSDSVLACVSPSVVDDGEVNFFLKFDDIGPSRGSASYMYLEDVILTSLAPRVGSVQGGTPVLISSVNFPVSTFMTCSFGTESVPGRLINSSLVECLSPAAPAGTVQVHLSINGVYAYDGNGFTFTYRLGSVISSVYPHQGGSDGGTNVTITGSGFSFHDELSCRFGNSSEVVGVYVSDSVIRCETPAHAVGAVPVELSLGDGMFVTSPSEFTFVTVPVVESISPSLGSVNGGTVVTVTGTGFSSVNDIRVRCIFGVDEVEGSVVSDQELECTSPAALIGGQVRVTVALNGVDSSRGAVNFMYTEDVVVTAAYPLRGDTTGGSAVVIAGMNFPPAQSVSCKFGLEAVAGRMIHSTSLECTSPPGVVGTVPLSIELDGLHIGSDELQFSYIPVTEVISMYPHQGGSDGGTNVTITGSGFSFHDELSCRFGNSSEVAGVYVSDSVIRCETPAHAVGAVPVELSLGDGMFVTSPSEFTFVTVPVVESISPSLGSVNGGTVVTVTGYGFDVVSGGGFQCVFGDVGVEGNVTSNYTVKCISPSGSDGTLVEVSFSFHTTIISSDSFFFGFNAATVVFSFQGTRKKDGFAISLYGDNFVSSVDYFCTLGEVGRTEAAFMSVHTVDCFFSSSDIVSYQNSEQLVSLDLVDGTSLWSDTIYLSAELVVEGVAMHSDTTSALIVDLAYYPLDNSSTIFKCLLNGFLSDAIILTPYKIACDISKQDISAPSSIFYALDVVSSVWSSPFILPALNFSMSDDVENVNNGDLSREDFTALPAAPFAYHRSWFSAVSVPPPSDIWVHALSSSSVHTRVQRDEVYIISNRSLYDLHAADENHCFLDANIPCTGAVPDVREFFSDDATLKANFSMENTQSTHLEDTLVIDRVSNNFINPINGSWISITGRSFTNATQCMLNGQMSSSTVFLSSTSLQCFIPAALDVEDFNSLTTVDIDTGYVSENSVTLSYDILDIVLRQESLSVLNNSMNMRDVVSVPKMSDFASWCASSGGCLNGQNSFDFHNNSVRNIRSQGRYKWAANQDAHPLDWDRLDNETTVHVESTGHYHESQIYVDVGQPTTTSHIGEVFLMEPDEVTFNSTAPQLFFYGSNFASNISWCCSIQDAGIFPAMVFSYTELQCSVFLLNPPGVYEVDILHDCLTVTETFNLTVLPKMDDVLSSGDVWASSPLPVMTSVLPSAGSTGGGTAVTITGEHLEGITACKFEAYDSQNQLLERVVVEVDSASKDDPETTRCITRQFHSACSYNMYLYNRNQTWIPLNTQFVTFTPPVVEMSFLIDDGASTFTHSVVILGLHFDNRFSVSCRVDFSDGSHHYTAGRVITSEKIMISDYSFWKTAAIAVSISFNGVDFVDAKFHSRMAALSLNEPKLGIPYNAATSSQFLDIGGNSSLGDEQSLISIDMTPTAYLSEVCDGTQQLQVSSSVSVSPFDRLVCAYENTSVLTVARPTGTDRAVCSIPILSPGSYVVKLQKQVSDTEFLELSRTDMQCAHLPIITSAYLNKQSVVDGSHTIVFQGFHLFQTLQLQCFVDNIFMFAAIQSGRSISCVFPPMYPSVKSIGVRVGEMTSIFEINSCVTEDNLLRGADLISTTVSIFSDCNEVIIEEDGEVHANESLDMKTIRQGVTYWPRMAVTTGSSAVELIAEELTADYYYDCVFGEWEVAVPAYFIGPNHLLCYTPAMEPSQGTLYVNSSSGDRWDFGEFYFINTIKIREVSLSSISRPGLVFIKIEVANISHIENLAEFYCHVGDEIIPAHIASSTVIICQTEFSAAAKHVALFLGSEAEAWSNTVNFSLEEYVYDKVSFSPLIGSVSGGTEVRVTLPKTNIPHLDELKCVFNGMNALHVNCQETSNETTVICLSPAGLEGRVRLIVSVPVYDSGSLTEHDMLTLASTVYTYQRPSEVVEIFPTNLMQGLSHKNDVLSKEVFLQGTNFVDSKLLQCVVNETFWLPARWHAVNMISCQIPVELTLSATPLSLRSSNNGFDKSATNVILHVTARQVATAVSPLLGYTVGGTTIEVLLLDYFETLSVYCQFDVQKVRAYRDEVGVYYCTSPPANAGTQLLEIVLDNAVIATFSYEYVAVPTVSFSNPSVVLSSFENVINLVGSGFHRGTSGRFRRGDGAVKDGNCEVENSTAMACLLTPLGDEKDIYVDISVNNGADFIMNFAVFQILEPTKVIVPYIPSVYRSGGGFVTLSLVGLHSQESTFCEFVEHDTFVQHARPIIFTTENEVSCSIPAFSSSKVYLYVKQLDFVIYGPFGIRVNTEPTVLNVTPTSLQAGMSTVLSFEFSNSGDIPSSMDCIFDKFRYPLQMLSSHIGTCLVQPLRAGVFELSLSHTHNLNGTISIRQDMVVFDGATDVSFNTTAVLSFETNVISIASESCSFPPSLCRQGADVVSTPLLMTSCEVHCEIKPFNSHHANTTLLALFTHGSMDAPYVTHVLDVYGAAVISSRYPPAGSTLGGTTLSLYGVGFSNNGFLECAFGDKVVPAVFSSYSLVQCVSPPSEPRNVTVNVRRDGRQVTSSTLSYEYVPLTPISAISTDDIFSIGGSVVDVTVAEMSTSTMFKYQCKFTDIVVNAVPVNSTLLRCITPAMAFKTVDFSLVNNGADVSFAFPLNVIQPPTVLLVEPMGVPSNIPIDFTVLLSDAIFIREGAMKCAINGITVTAEVTDTVVDCRIPSPGLSPGENSLVISIEGVEFYKVEILSRTPIVVNRVTPRIGFAVQESTVRVYTVAPVERTSHAKCCFDFGEVSDVILKQALLAGPNQWECFSPTIENNMTRTAIIGMMGSDGICESTSFPYRFVPFPDVLSVDPVEGPLSGGTVVTIHLSKPLSRDVKVFCRIGEESFATERSDSYSIQCVTRNSAAGVNFIELSVNGIDFLPIPEFKFEYKLLVLEPNDVSSDADVAPFVYKLSPNSVSSSRPEYITFLGTGFVLGSYCLMNNDYILESTYVSATELVCLSPINAPGQVQIKVINPATGMASKSMELTFLSGTSHMEVSVDGGIFPPRGPRTGGTAISITGLHFDAIDKSLLCRIGDDYVFASVVSSKKLKCVTPSSSYSGVVSVRITTEDREVISGATLFEYVEDPILLDVQPHYGTVGTLVQMIGKGFTRNHDLECLFGDIASETVVVSDTVLTCVVPLLSPDQYRVTVRTNGQQSVLSGLLFNFMSYVILDSLSPVNGPALRGNTMLTIHGQGFVDSVDLRCVLGNEYLSVPAVYLSDEMVRCRLPSHKPGLVNISIVSEGTRLHASSNFLEFMYNPDVSVDKITPEFGYTSGGYPVFVFGSNFVNTTFLGCKFGDMKSRGIFLSNTSVICLAPSPLGRAALRGITVKVDVTVNGVDYSENGIEFDYSEPCDEGWFCPGMSRQLCPNGTYCPINSRNFTLCPPGSFQPKEGQVNCASCPVGYICPDHGMPRPVICPAGQICDTQGLRASTKNCPMGHYCLNGTKSSSALAFQNNSRDNITNLWNVDYVTGIVIFNASAVNWDFISWDAPAVGESRVAHPPEASCDGMICTPGTTAVIAEAPYPCPIGHYCRAGVGAQFPIPKNFSTPQRCFDGFFCPRGSINPEGKGPCPTGYFCPTQLDAIVCPRGHYCPGVGNRGPVECYPGTYNPSEARSNCTVCPTGHACPGWGSLLPELCPAGFVCSALGLSYPVVLCPAGYLCEDGTVTLDPSDPTDKKPIPCDSGTFCLGGVSRRVKVAWIPQTPWGANTPQNCSEGTYCKSGAFEPSGSGQCFQGHYCPPSLAFPIETPIGNFAFEEGAVAPTLCFPGTYAPLKAQISCLPCPAGHGCSSYGTYIPTICSPGTFRSVVDSVSCRLCLTGTFSDEWGAVDVSMCLPCPEGRVCGIQGIYNLIDSTVCPAGYTCGFGTDRTRQFLHKAPAGYHTVQQTIPSNQYGSTCFAGFYCVRGTSTALALRAKCGVGYFCPEGTATAAGQEVKCPRTTTSLSGVDQVNDCRIADVDVCDKAAYDLRYPMQDLMYYPFFEYTSIDGEDSTLTFDSSTTAINPTGEVVVTSRIYSINESTSSPLWVNDTIEVFRTCPSYGSAAYDIDNRVQIIGRNFRDSGQIYCRWHVCLSADEGKYPKRCRNRGTSSDSTDLPYAGEMEPGTKITRGNFISTHRVECDVPKYIFNEAEIADSLAGKCEYVDNDGFLRDNALEGNLSYIRTCADLLNCPNLPNEGEEYFQDLSFECSSSELTSGYCTHTPEYEHMFNPCYTQELLVEVTNNAHTYSGGDNLEGITINATVVPEDQQQMAFSNYFIPPTFAEFTYVRESYWYEDADILGMETDYCNIPRYSEEYPRERESGWFMMRANEVAHIHIDLKHIPEHLVYGEHYRFALYVTPSRCTDEVCNANRVRLAPQENVPCKQPKEFSEWFLDTSVQKNTTNNITVYALDDILFKIEIHVTVGLFATFGHHFVNTTTVRIVAPRRARVVSSIENPAVRELSQFVSFEKQLVPVTFMFGVVYSRDFSDSISMPLNLPPRGSEYERGRVLVSYNKSEDADEIPDILDTYTRIAVGPNFWDTLAATTMEAKEIYDAYFEVFHGMTHADGAYEEAFTQFLSPHMLFFSNCRTFDSHIPMWLLLEGKECELPDEEDMGPDWRRFRYPALPDQDDITVVGPWDFLQDPIADYCGRSLICQYEEVLDTLDVVPRWFEAASGDELFSVIREPISYFDLTGRPDGAKISADDVGSGEAISNIVVSDIFKAVVVDREAANDFPGGCTLNCYPREMTLDIGYYQIDKMIKRLIYINLVYDSFDYDSEFTEYTLEIDYYPLGYFDLLVNFAFEADIFVILFLFVGGVTVALAFIYWIVVRIFTSLQNPPELRVFNMFSLVAPPPTAGITLALIPVGAMTMAAYYLISGDRLQDEKAEVGNWYLDDLQLEYIYIGGRLDPNEQERARNGRLGICFCIIAFFCCFAGTKIFLPKKVSKREQEIALKRDKMAEKESIWAPTLWKRSNLMFCSILMGLFLVLIVEFSYWGDFGTYVWWIVLMLKVFAQFIDALVEYQLRELLLVSPISSALNITQALITLGADDFVDFVLVYYVEMALLVVERVYIEPFLSQFLDWLGETIDNSIVWVKKKMPKYLQKNKGKQSNVPEVDYRKRDVDDDVGDDDAETVEPILDHYLNVCMDTLSMYYTVFLIYLLMLFREEIVLPSLYGIAEQDMLYYLYFSIVIIFFLFIQDILLHSVCELFHGWKIYEYLVYTRYRFLQRETRWKGMETSLDECIDEGMRTLDQMCFSSQFYLMLTIHCNGIMYILLGVEMMLRAQYNPFGDTAFVFILLYLIFCYVVLERFIMWFVVKIKLWKIKHENTSWHLQLDEEDDLDVPAWEDAKGASHDAYLMNQRITSETFRYKFLNYNRAWLIQQLPSLLTPRTLRRSRPYLINQFARIINSRRDDISDDSDGDVKNKFGPVALSSSSRNIIRFWLDRARRRLRLKEIVDPLIRQARGSECEQCLSRKQLNIEYEIDMDQMMTMYDNLHPHETEVDQVEWKRFWKKNQRYHTICMVCISKRKDDSRNKARKKLGQYDDLNDDRQEDYPDWGPVFLTAASKAILLNWYRKAQKLRASKKGRRDKKAPKQISDDEGDDVPRAFGEKQMETTPATQAIAIKWMRTARARLQQKGGKGASAMPSAQSIPLSNTFKKSGNKSKSRKK